MARSGRALAWGLAGLVTGVLCAAAAPPWPAWMIGLQSGLLLLAVLSAIGLAIDARASAQRQRALLPWFEARIAALSLFGGIVLFSFAASTQAERSWPDERAGEVHLLQGRVIGLPVTRGERIRFLLRAGRAPADLRTIELSWYRPDAWPRPGERWALEVRLDAPSARLNPGGWDRGRARFARRIDAVGRVESGRRLTAGGVVSALPRFRQNASDWLQARIADLDAAALVRALAVGDRSGIGPDLAKRLRDTGTAHLLAISGLHVGLVFGFGALLVGAFSTVVGLRWPWPERRRQAVIGGLVAAGLYAALSGFALPTRRALLMLCVAIGATLLRRPIAPGRALLLALAVVLLLDPLAPLALGFWLSFAAVAVLVWAFSGRPGPGQGGAIGLVRAQLVLGLGLLPLNIGLFHQLTPAALPANLLAIPAVALAVLPVSLAGVLGFGAGLTGLGLAELSGRSMSILARTLEQLAALAPPRSISWQPGLVEIGLAGVGALWLLAPRGWPARPLGLLCLLPLLMVRPESLPQGGFDLHLLDLGDGQAVAVRTRSATWLYGVGAGDGAEASQVPGTIGPSLRSIGAADVDVLVVPGHDRLQSGGLSEARRAWPAARVIGRHPSADRSCTAGQVVSIDGVEFRFLHPSMGLPEQGGNDDCVLLISSTAGRVLLTGRVGTAGIRRLRGRSGPLDAVVVPRQGHRAGMDSTWWNEIRPQLALISAQRNQRFGLPHAEVIEALRDRSIPLLNTADCGAISLTLRPGQELAVRTESGRLHRWWRPAGRCGLP